MAMHSVIFNYTATAQNTKQAMTADSRTPAQLPTGGPHKLLGALVVAQDGNLDRIYVQAEGIAGTSNEAEIDTTVLSAAGIGFFPIEADLVGGATPVVSLYDGKASSWVAHSVALIIALNGQGLPSAMGGGKSINVRESLSGIGATLTSAKAAVVSGLTTGKTYELIRAEVVGTGALCFVQDGNLRTPLMPSVMTAGRTEFLKLLDGKCIKSHGGGDTLYIEAVAPATSGTAIINSVYREASGGGSVGMGSVW